MSEKKNWFPTLSDALESENILHMWNNSHIKYNETKSITYDDGSKYGHFVSIYRNEKGLYERPVHYARG